MNRWISNTLGIVLIAAVASGIYGAWGGWRQVLVAVDHWGNAAPDLKPTLATLNRPCGIRNVKSSANYSTFYSEGSLMPCGTLAEIATSVVKAGDAVVQTQLVERATTPHVTAAMDQFGMAAQHLSGTADSLKGTADALTGTAQGATATLAESQRTIKAAQPLLAQLTANGASLQATTDTLNDVLKRQAIGKLLDNAAGISGDFRTIADKATADFIRPVPWWQQPIRKSGQLIDIGAAIARHIP
jgi:hypothetical protein